MNDYEILIKQAEDLLNQDVTEDIMDDVETILLQLRRKPNTPELIYEISKLLINFGEKTKNPRYLNEAIGKLKSLDENDFPRVHFYLGTAYLKKFEILEEKPSYLFDSEKLLRTSKWELKKYISMNPNGDLHNAYVNLGAAYSKIGRTIEALDVSSYIFNKYSSEHGLYNMGHALYTFSKYSDNQRFCVKKAYNCFKLILDNPHLRPIFRTRLQNLINSMFEEYGKEFFERDDEEEHIITIDCDNDLEFFMKNYWWEHKLYLNFCNFCQYCSKSVEDSLVIEKMIYSNPEGYESSFSMLSAYLNQIKMDFVSARSLLALSECEEIDLDNIAKDVYLINIEFNEETDIRVQLLKDAFKNFFNILDKIAFFIKDYLKFTDKYDKIDFTTLWFEPEIREELIKVVNPGLDALYDIYLELDDENDKKYLRDTRNTLTHKYLRITYEIQEITDKTLHEFKNELFEIANIVRNAIIYLMRFIKINEDCREEELGLEFIPVEEIVF